MFIQSLFLYYLINVVTFLVNLINLLVTLKIAQCSNEYLTVDISQQKGRFCAQGSSLLGRHGQNKLGGHWPSLRYSVSVVHVAGCRQILVSVSNDIQPMTQVRIGCFF